MAAIKLTRPSADDDVRKLYLHVIELQEYVEAIMNMTVVVDGRIRMIGKLDMKSGSSELRIEELSEVGSLGT